MTKNSGSLDANILLRLLLRDIPKQSDLALGLVTRSGVFHIADTAIIEVVFALERYYEIPRKDIATYIMALIHNPQLNCPRKLFTTALDIYPNHAKLSFEDCCLAVYAELNSALPLWTFDKKLAGQLGVYARELR